MRSGSWIDGAYAPPNPDQDRRRKVSEMRPLLHEVALQQGISLLRPVQTGIEAEFGALLQEAARLGLVRFRAGLVRLTRRGWRRVYCDRWGQVGYQGPGRWVRYRR